MLLYQFQSDWPNMSKVKRKVRKGKEQHEDANIKSSSAPAGQILCCVPEDIGGKIWNNTHGHVLDPRFKGLFNYYKFLWNKHSVPLQAV